MGGSWMFEALNKAMAGPTRWGIGLAVTVVVTYVLTLVYWAKGQHTASPTNARARPDRPDRPIPAWATPRGRPLFIALAALFSIAIWLAAWLLAPEHRAFLASREWQAQPLYLFMHFVTLRLFASIFAANFLAGTAHLDMAADQPGHAVRRILGPAALLPAAALALPFIGSDLRYFLSDRYTKLSGSAEALAVDWLMFAIWACEWLLNAVVWVMLIGFLVLNLQALRRHAFRDPIHVVLAEKHYRPFLRMSAQGATVLLIFSAATVVYIWHAGGEATDYLGLMFTVALLAVSFVPPWLMLRHKVNGIVRQEMGVLHQAVSHTTAVSLLTPMRAPDPTADAPPEPTPPDHGREALALMRMLHLDRLHNDVGRREATDVAVRLMAPAATVGWQLWQNGATLADKATTWLKAILG